MRPTRGLHAALSANSLSITQRTLARDHRKPVCCHVGESCLPLGGAGMESCSCLQTSTHANTQIHAVTQTCARTCNNIYTHKYLNARTHTHTQSPYTSTYILTPTYTHANTHTNRPAHVQMNYHTVTGGNLVFLDWR